MASGLKCKRAAGFLAALFPLWGFCLVRLWAFVAPYDDTWFHSLPGTRALLFLMAAAPAIFALAEPRLRRLLRPFSNNYVNLSIAVAAGLLGAGLDTSYAMVDVAGTPLAHPFFRVLSALGSGLVFAWLVLAVLTAARAWGRVEMGAKRQMLLLFALVNALALFYLATSATVYVWDNAGYWSVARTLAAQPMGLRQLREVAASVVAQEYNYLLALPISLIMRLFGGSRAVFVLSTVNLYLLPALWGLCALGRERRWGGVLLALLFPGLTYLALVGFVDVAACAVAIWAVVFYTREDAPAWTRGLLTGVLLALSFLLRRYFLFFAVAFGLAAGLLALCRRTREEPIAFGSLFAAGAVSAVYFTQAFLVDKLTTDYGDLYSAYALGLKSDAMLFCRYFGYLLLAAALLWGLYRSILRREGRGDALLALVTLFLCFFLVSRIQSHGQQHTLLYVPCLALLLAPGRTEPRWKEAAAWVLAAACSLTTLLPRPQPASIAAIPAPDPVPGFSFFGPRRGDVDQLLALDDYLDGLAKEDGGSATCAVCASSLLLNSETLINLRPSLSLAEGEGGMTYIYVSSVDKRDSFTWSMLDADYLVVGDPVQVHLGEENQRVVALPAHAVLEGTGLGTAYERLQKTFALQDGSKVYIYRRTRQITQAERKALSQTLQDLYPDYAWLYQLPN